MPPRHATFSRRRCPTSASPATPKSETSWRRPRSDMPPCRGRGAVATAIPRTFPKPEASCPAEKKATCLNCHSTDDLGKPPLKNIGKQLARGKSREGKEAGTAGKISARPPPEGALRRLPRPPRLRQLPLLTGPYPADFYAPYPEGGFRLLPAVPREVSLGLFPDHAVHEVPQRRPQPARGTRRRQAQGAHLPCLSRAARQRQPETDRREGGRIRRLG